MKNLRIAFISFLAMWAVVVWHCYCGSSVERWFLPIFCYWSVPWFFVISGYYLLASFDKRNIDKFIVNKFWSLFMPYLLWCMIGILFFYIFSPHEISLNLNDIFALGDVTQPKYNKPLWYVRALLILNVIGLCILVPLRYFRVEHGLLRLALFTCFFLVLVFLVQKFGLTIGPGSSAFYFLCGIWCSYLMKSILKNFMTQHLMLITIVALIMAMLFRGIWFSRGYSFYSSGGSFIGNLATVFFIIMLVGAVCLIKKSNLPICDRSLHIYARVFSMSSFVYFFHRPLLTCLIEKFDGLVDNNVCVRNMEFVILAVFYPAVCMLIGLILKRHCQKMYLILTGGR